MGGRGASYGGRSGRAPRGYRTVGKIRGISIVRNTIKKSGLPTRAPANSVYFGTNSIGKIVQLRFYGKDGQVIKDIDWVHSFAGHRNGTVHWHKWKNNKREEGHYPLSKSDIKKYKDIIETATEKKDFIWEW